MITSKYIEWLAVLTNYGIYRMIRMEFNTYDDGTYYFLYITEEVRIETNGINGLQMETHDWRVRDSGDPFQYLTIRKRKDKYFNEAIVNPYTEVLIIAAITTTTSVCWRRQAPALRWATPMRR